MGCREMSYHNNRNDISSPSCVWQKNTFIQDKSGKLPLADDGDEDGKPETAFTVSPWFRPMTHCRLPTTTRHVYSLMWLSVGLIENYSPPNECHLAYQATKIAARQNTSKPFYFSSKSNACILLKIGYSQMSEYCSLPWDKIIGTAHYKDCE